MDMSSAFDLISHQPVYSQRLYDLVGDRTFRLLWAMAINLKVFIEWQNTTYDTPIRPTAGVKQGGKLSALLFAYTLDTLSTQLRTGGAR